MQELNPIPYAGILGQTSGQVIYGSIIRKWYELRAPLHCCILQHNSVWQPLAITPCTICPSTEPMRRDLRLALRVTMVMSS